MTTLLAGDIGGTKTLLALYTLSGQQLERLAEERYSSADWDDLTPMVRRFLSTAGQSLPGREAQPTAACFAVAGPVQRGRARLTNLPWLLDQTALAADIGMASGRVELVNDFAVLIYGLPHLQAQQQAVVRPGCGDPDGTLLVLGAGTGLGVAYGLRTPQGLVALASEAAHAEFAPRSEEEWRLKRWLQADLGVERLSIERVVSGTGLGQVGRWLMQERHADGSHPLQRNPPADLPAAMAEAAAAGDALARDALDLWLGAYGSVVGDLALTGLSRGGIWLAGGTAGKLLRSLGQASFAQAFLAKGRLAPVLEKLPITAITDPAIGLYSAACRARMLLKGSAAALAS